MSLEACAVLEDQEVVEEAEVTKSRYSRMGQLSDHHPHKLARGLMEVVVLMTDMILLRHLVLMVPAL
jgi:hypothetical protein